MHRMLRVIAIITFASLVGCAALGPKEIHYGRTNYNSVIQRTANDQMFLNIIRAKNSEPTLFMDVTEVDAAAIFQAQISGGATGIGAREGKLNTTAGTIAGLVGNVGAQFQYQEQPTIRYQPLLGQPLVQQLVRPVDVDSIWFLSDSTWPLSSILSFSVNYLSPNYEDHFSALNAILQLDAFGALAIAAVKSDWIHSSAKSDKNNKNDDALVLYLEPNHVQANNADDLDQKRKEVLDLWIRLLSLYKGIPQRDLRDPKTTAPQNCDRETGTWETLASNSYLYDLQKRIAGMQPKEVTRNFQCLPNWLELRTSPLELSTETEGKFMAPVMRTRSALGILKTSAQEDEGSQIEFLKLETYKEIRKRQLKDLTTGWDFYILSQGERKTDNTCHPQGAHSQPGCDDRNLNAPTETGPDNCADWKEVVKAIQAFSSNSRDNGDPALKNAEQVCKDDKILEKCGRKFMDMCVILKIRKDISSGEIPYTYYGVYSPMNVDSLIEVKMENRLAHFRRFILIIEDDSPPEQNGITPFVSCQVVDDDTGRNTWYYIDNSDRISKINFDLLLEFFTIMAIPPQTPPLQPAISVSPR